MKTYKKSDRIDTLVVSIALFAIYIALGAKALNLDGLGYAGRVESNDLQRWLLPGHLLYTPIMRAIYLLVSSVSPNVDAAYMMQFCDAVFAAIGVGVFIAALKRLELSRFTSIAAGLALAFSYTYWTHSTDLTTYSLSTLCLICAFYMLCASHARKKMPHIWGLGAWVVLATLIHQSNVVFLPAAMTGFIGYSKSGERSAIKLAAISLALIIFAYAVFAWVATGSFSPSTVARWALGGAHGYAPTFEPVNAIRGIYGFSNAVIYLDDAGTLIKGSAAGISGSKPIVWDIARLVAKGIVLALILAVPFFTHALRRMQSINARWGAAVCAAWILPYALVALLFFTTDHDRWIMLMPAVIALAAIARPHLSSTGKFIAVAIVGALFCLNMFSAVYPAHTGESNKYYKEARLLATRLAPTDLVIFWGHDHIGTAGYLRRIGKFEAAHVIDIVRNEGKLAALSNLREMIENALALKRRVLIIGLYGVHDGASDYLSEAHVLGVTRADIVNSLSAYAARPCFYCNACPVYELGQKSRRSSLSPVFGGGI